MARRMKEQFEDVSSYSSSKEYKKRKKNRRGRAVVRGFLSVLCVLLILVGAGMIYISTDLIGDLTTTTITKDPVALGIQENAILDNSIRNIALFGVDSRNNAFIGQSDVIMILTVDNRHHSIKMTSIMRDTRVPIEGETLAGGYLDNWDTKINAAYNEGGPELAIRTLNRHFGLDIKDYVTINFVNMAAIVDAFGGVEMEVTGEEMGEINQNLWTLSQEVGQQMAEDEANGVYNERNYAVITDDDYFRDAYGGVEFDSPDYQGGLKLLNGNQAVAYGRIRNIGNDYARVGRQQKVFSALVKRLKSIGVTDYPGLIKQMMPYCETNLGLEDIVSMVPILTSSFDIQSITVPDPRFETDLFDGKAEDDVYYLIYDVTGAAQRISAFVYEEESPYWDEYGNTAGEVGENGVTIASE